MIFDYQAKDHVGKTTRGFVEAPSLQLAADILKERKLIIISLRERRKNILFSSSFNILNRISLKDLAIFARQLSVMMNSGVPLVRALRILVGQTSNINFKVIIADVADEVEGGAKLSTAMSRYQKVFDHFFIQMIRSGETTGKLDETLNYLADQKEKDYDFNSKIFGSLMYPIFVLISLFVVGILMMVYVIPKLTDVLQDSGVNLPTSTKVLIAVSTFFQRQWWLVILFVAACVVSFVLYRQTSAGRRALDTLKLRLPVFGELFKKFYMTRFSRSLSTLLSSGIPLSQSLSIVSDIVGNVVYHDVILAAAEEIEQGNSIASAFLASKYVPQMVPQMMRVGEQTGKLDQVLSRVSQFYTRESENMIANLVTLIEPLVMIVLGIGVAILIAGILLPMYSLSSAL